MEEELAAREGKATRNGRTTRPLDITVLMGGPSTEREISIMSGTAIADGLARVGHHVIRADITPEDTSSLDRKGIEVVFIALHGDFGESGEVQALCEAKGLSYTGSPPRASELAMDKAATKQICRRMDLPTPDWMIIEEFHTPRQAATWLGEIAPPVVVKPVDGGSSLDIYIAADEAGRDEALDKVLDKYGRAILERFVPGREFTVNILGEKPLPALEIIPARSFYDYAAKYNDGAGTQYVFDHNLPSEQVEALQHAALTIHSQLGCRDMSRSDFIVDSNGLPQFLEINTIPGFTSHSLLPMAAARAGINFDELVDRLVAMAIDR